MKNIFKYVVFSFNYRLLNLYQQYGINIKKKNQLKDILFEDIFKKLLEKVIVRKDILLKDSYYKKLFFIESGSYKGYRLIRGLPLYHQRTKTNAKTNQKENLSKNINKKKKKHFKKKKNEEDVF